MALTHEDIVTRVTKQMDAAAARGMVPPELTSTPAAPQPPAPPAAGSGAPAQGESPSPAPQPPTEQPPGFDIAPLIGENGMLLGKYKDSQALRDAYWHTVNSGSALAKENDQLRAQLAALAQGSPPAYQSWNQAPTVPGTLPGSGPRVNPAARDFSQERTVAKLAEELGVDPRVVSDAFQTIAGPPQPQVDAQSIEQIVQNAVQQALAPIQAQTEAETYMRQHYPEAIQHRQELEMFVRIAPPEVQQDIATFLQVGNQAGAYRYAWQAYQDAVRSHAQTQLTTQSQAAEAERVAARGAASMPSAPQGTPPHQGSNTAAANAEQEEKILKAAQAGDYNAKRAYAVLKFGSLPGLKEKLDSFAQVNPMLPNN